MEGLQILPGDILAQQDDPRHDNDIVVTRVEPGAQPDEWYAYYEGEAPRNLSIQKFELVRPLCEPHDLYALGALFFFILTEDLRKVAKLRGLLNSVEETRCPMNPSALWARDLYPAMRGAVREHYFQDELMVLILRAMTRGLPESFAASRIERGPEPAQRLLREVRRLYHRMQRDILSAHRARARLVASAVALLLITGLLLSTSVMALRASRARRDMERADAGERHARRLLDDLRGAEAELSGQARAREQARCRQQVGEAEARLGTLRGEQAECARRLDATRSDLRHERQRAAGSGAKK